MTTKVTTTDIANFESQTTAAATINANFAALCEVIDTLLSTDGTAPNQLEASLDMNSNRILNLPTPLNSSEPARLIDIQNLEAISGLIVPDLTGNEDKILTNDGSILSWVTSGSGDMLKADNLAGLASTSASRTNLGLGTAALANVGTSGNNVPKLDAANTWSAAQIMSALLTLSAGLTVSAGEVRLSSTLASMNTDSAGFRGIPVTTHDADYTFLLNDAGEASLHTSASAHAWTIPPDVFPVGAVISGSNIGSGAVTITRGSGVVLRGDNSATDKNFSAAQWSNFSLWQRQSNSWVAFGSGLS